MRYATLLIPLLLLPLPLQAAPQWQFSEKIAVTEKPLPGRFHHLDSAGRRSVALSGDQVAVTWEDNRSGKPQIYYAVKSVESSSFSSPIQISNNRDAYEPAIAGVSNGNFILVWEEDGAVVARTAKGARLGPVAKLSNSAAGHATTDSFNGKAYIAWREKRGRYPNIHFTQVTTDKTGVLTVSNTIPVEPDSINAPQLYPTIAAGAAGIAIAWEDRREGHTRLLFSHTTDGKTFSEPGNLNKFRSNRNEYDKGNGVTRVAIAAFGEDEIVATWMDKRRSKTGYGIYASLGYDGGEEYGPNERVQGKSGDKLPHYNPTVAGNSVGAMIVAWDDYRSKTSDIQLSTYTDDMEWSEDFTPPVASGPGEQSNPSIAMDEAGNLHLVWIEASEMGKPSQIWYASAVPSERE
ncbi:MAG: hypothetical protein ABW148_03520 [Sedimenticola sp.]